MQPIYLKGVFDWKDVYGTILAGRIAYGINQLVFFYYSKEKGLFCDQIKKDTNISFIIFYKSMPRKRLTHYEIFNHSL